MPFAALVVEIAVSYLISRLTQPNGPRVTNLAAGGGDYGVFKPVIFGEKFRVAGVLIAEDDIKETVHKHKPATDFLFGIAGALLPSTKTYTYSVTLAILLADRTNDEPIEGLSKLYAGGKVIFRATESSVVSETLDGQGRLVKRKYGKNKYCKSVTVYGGGYDQTADPILNAVLDEDQPGYRGTAYAVIEDLQLKDFGNAPPLPIEALVVNKTGQSVATAVEKICAVGGIDTARDMSSTALADLLLLGCGIVDQGSCWDAVKPMLPAFAVDAAEVAGQIRFYDRDQSLRATIPADDMGAYVYGDSPPEKFTFSRSPDLKLPRETSLTFVDATRDYQPNTAKSERSEGDAQSNIDVTLPIVLTTDQGASAAALLLWDEWLGRSQGRFTLTDAWNLEPGLAYAVPIADQYVPYRITRRTRGANGITEVEAVSDESVTYTAQITGSSGTPIDPGTTLFADTRIVLIDGAILNDSDDEYGFYVALAGTDPSWSEGLVEGSLDGITYLTLVDTSDSAIIGDVTGTLAAGTTDGLDDTLDTTSTLTVVLLHDGMELSSAADDELDLFANMAFVGKDGMGEYLQFKTATFISGTTWELTDLRRGRKGTDWAIAAHASGEEFALLTEGDAIRLPATTLDSWGVAVDMRGRTFDQDEADAEVISFTNTGEGKRPYSPVNVTGDWDGSDNLTVDCDLRSRLNAGGLGIDDQDNVEYQFTDAVPVRSIIGTGTTSVTYLAADQVTDGLTPGETVVGRVRQLSDVNNGRWRNFTLIGPNSITFDSTLITMDDTTLTMDAG